MTKVLQDIWQDTLVLVRRSVPAERFQLWFNNTELMEQDGGTCEIGVPNAFVGEWLREHFSDIVCGALGSITGQEVRVRFVVSPVLYQKTHEEQLRQKQELVEAIDSSLSKGTPSAVASRREYRLEDFVVGSSNRLAFAAASHVATRRDGSLNPLFIHGAVGLGKTHLLRSICRRWNQNEPGTALYMPAESFTNQFLASLQHRSVDGFHRKFRDIELLALDDLHFLANKRATQDKFLQIYNLLTNSDKQVILASHTHPADITSLPETLTTRLVSGMMVRLDAPGYETRLAILHRKLGPKREVVGDDVLAFIAENLRGNVRELEGATTTLTATAALAGEEINLNTARRALASLMPSRDARVTVEAIEEAVAIDYRVTVKDMHSTRRHKSITLPRHVAIHLTRELTPMSWKEIGRHFGRSNHTGALYAHRKITETLETDPLLADRVKRLRSQLGG